jgi:Protein of unknown function (DUF3309)
MRGQGAESRVAWNDPAHYSYHPFAGGFSRRFRGYGYGYGHRGIGLIGVIVIIILILVLLNRI